MMVAMDFLQNTAVTTLVVLLVCAVGFAVLLSKFYRKVEQGKALIRNGTSGTRVSFSGMIVIPILHVVEYMDVSVKRIAIDRRGDTGLICRDNLRADIQVAFFVRVNTTIEDVKMVAQSLGCERASDEKALYELFDAKFSEALKTVGKRFDFVDLYTNRDKFKDEILQVIGRDLNGYVLEDAAIDFLEQTDKELLNPNNILDAEGIKKITLLTASEYEAANAREREKDKTITKQDVEAKEAILELNKQLAEAEAKQEREIAEITAREAAAAKVVEAEERERKERARISADEQVAVAEENMKRQVIVAEKNKERTDRVEAERVTRDQQLEKTERERLVLLAEMTRDKAVEAENKELQGVIRERVAVEKSVVAEQERIKDTAEFATAERSKRVQITKAEEEAEQALVKDIKEAEAAKRAASEYAEKQLIEADANEKAAVKNAEAVKTLAEADVKKEAVKGLAEADVMSAQAGAFRIQGQAEADVIALKAEAKEKEGTAEATVMQRKYSAEATGITEKADAMKQFHDAGKEHEEFKLGLDKDLQVELAEINIRKEIATEQSKLVSEGLKQAKIDIIGGENQFFERLVNSISYGKSVDRAMDNSKLLTEMKQTFVTGDSKTAVIKLQEFISQFGLSSEDVRNLTVSALVVKLIGLSDDSTGSMLQGFKSTVEKLGMGDKKVSEFM